MEPPCSSLPIPALPCWAACPVLLIQVRLQTQTTYQGIIDCMVKTYRHESVGVLLLWGFGMGGIWVVRSSFLLPWQGAAPGREKPRVWGYPGLGGIA